MDLVWSAEGPFRRASYESEAKLEQAISRIQDLLFGPERFYLDVKRKIGAVGGQRNIPDGYLVDLTGAKPALYVVEVELASHDPLRHIAVQILQFSLAFEEEPRTVKAILMDALRDAPPLLDRCTTYAAKRSYRNLDHLLEAMVFETPFAALVIIDELPEKLESVLHKRFQFPVEVLEVGRYKNDRGAEVFRFEPFLADLYAQEPAPNHEDDEALARPAAVEPDEVDTIVVPAREEGFREVFLGENRWHEIRIHATMQKQIKYIAVYQVAPKSAITHIAPIRSIEPWADSGKYVVNFAEPAKEIGPITWMKGNRVKYPQSIRYTKREKLLKAKTLDDVW